MERIDKNNYKLSTGKTIYANNGIIGLSPDGLTIYNGYDGYIDKHNSEFNENGITIEEQKEIADSMIFLWTNFKDKIESKEEEA